MSDHYGQWQAQGDDMNDPRKGECVEWGQDEVPTKAEGTAWLTQVLAKCTQGQRARREGRAGRDAQRFVQRAPAGGHPSTSKHFYARDDGYPNARIDLEVYGLAFKDNNGA